MKKLILCISTLALLAIACQKLENNVPLNGDEMAPAVKMITETISGSRGVETKATIANDDASFKWSIGDNVAVHVSSDTDHKYVVTSSGASDAAATAAFEVMYDEGYTRDAFAVYPSTIVAKDAANYGQSSQTLDVTLPSEYPLAQVQGEVSPCPMIADNTGASWSFYQLCSLLRLTVNNIPPSTKRLEIDFDGKKVWGDFAIANPTPGNSTIATTADGDHDVIAITNSGNTFYSGWGDGKVFNIPLPVGDYSKITVTAFDASKDGNATLTVTRQFGVEAKNTLGFKRTVSFPVFSISSDKRVIFAPGNLQATTEDGGDTWNWHFAEHQYDVIGANPANTLIDGNGSVSDNGTVDLFGLSTESATYGINSYTSNYPGDFVFVDWGTLVSPANYWRTLRKTGTEVNGDIHYILNSRSLCPEIKGTQNAKYTAGTITISNSKSVTGIIIIPDHYVGPTSDVSNESNPSEKDIEWGTFNAYSEWKTKCTLDGWEILESEGCVFLPHTSGGYRKANSIFTNNRVMYWVYCTNKPTKYQPFQFGSTIYYNSTVGNYYGCAVRLVHDVN